MRHGFKGYTFASMKGGGGNSAQFVAIFLGKEMREGLSVRLTDFTDMNSCNLTYFNTAHLRWLLAIFCHIDTLHL